MTYAGLEPSTTWFRRNPAPCITQAGYGYRMSVIISDSFTITGLPVTQKESYKIVYQIKLMKLIFYLENLFLVQSIATLCHVYLIHVLCLQFSHSYGTVVANKLNRCNLEDTLGISKGASSAASPAAAAGRLSPSRDAPPVNAICLPPTMPESTINMFVFAPAVARPCKILFSPSDCKWCTNTKAAGNFRIVRSVTPVRGRNFHTRNSYIIPEHI